MRLSDLHPEFKLLPGYNETEDPEDHMAQWVWSKQNVDVWMDGQAFSMTYAGSYVVEGRDADVLLSSVRTLCTAGRPVVVASDGPAAFRAKVLLESIGYRDVIWLGEVPSDDPDELRESALSAMASALGSSVKLAGICVEAQCLGGTVRA